MANTMFSRRHYEAIAEILAENRPHTQAESPGTWAAIMESLADLFEADNPLDGKGRGFKREKFEEACER